MKTQAKHPILTNELTIAQLKAIALKQFNDEDFFFLEDASEVKVYEGTEEDARAMFEGDAKGKDGIDDFYLWASENLTEVAEYDEDDYNADYKVLTDEEADEAAAENIKDTLWAFNASFLADNTPLDEDVFEAIQENGKCEGNNDTIYNIIQNCGNMKDFISNAISADGRGHFLSHYDGNENEETVHLYPKGDQANQTFYIYRQN